MADTPLDFILRNKAFRLDELQAAYKGMGRTEKSVHENLKHHLAQRRLCRVRKGVYAHSDWVDPWFLATKLAPDVVISHDGALSFHDLIGVGNSLTFMTTSRASIARYQDIVFQPLRVDASRFGWTNAVAHSREGHPVFVTTLEATLVDCLATLAHAPPLEELMDAFKAAKKLKAKPDEMIKHALRYKSPLLCARLGFFLTCADFYLEMSELGRLRGGCSKRQLHFQRSKAKDSDRYFPPWELIVPRRLYNFLPGES